MANTPNFAIPLPDPEADVDEEFYRLQQAWAIVDAALWNLSQAIDGKAPSLHEHSMGQITGLLSALAGKMDASTTFELDDLTDVSGTAAAAIGYVLVKAAAGWQPSSPSAALGAHQHATGDIVGLSAAINAAVAGVIASAPTTLDTLNELAAALGDDPNFSATITALIGTKAARAITISAGTGLTGGGDLSANRTLSHADTSSAGSANNTGVNFIQGITLDGFGHVTALDSTSLLTALGAGTSAGGVGSYAMLYRTTGGEALPGTTAPGSSLEYSNANGNTSGTSPGGTWRCMGYHNTSTEGRKVTLWLRIS
ncbi:hypothetical protein [Rhizobium azibense]|uniref:Minor tail protein n=1 Tax=Rhizobium azibense TaxID=1136135 RepID=A0A4R3RIB9_9HYPH|nr:hypothetical protein [Rhizobium azibense]TCU35458.1 hypothetical protein EV129_10948 [Rhizobium azibense]